MTALRERLVRFRYRPQIISSHFIQPIGQQRQRLLCILNNGNVLALPDSGADLSLMSLRYARSRNLEIHHDRISLLYADNSEDFTVGSVIVQISFEKSKGLGDNYFESSLYWRDPVPYNVSDKFWAKMYVVKELVQDVILGTDFLQEHRVLESSSDVFLNLPEIPDKMPEVQEILRVNRVERRIDQTLRNVKGGKGTGKPASTLEEELEIEDQKENARRERESVRILAIEDRNEQRRAKEEEARIRHVYDAARSQKLAGSSVVT
ncbi:hypothetical protein BCR34DRAFT_589880 [Clohesyomyces aquaticus]|uniref:Uncharacterized protein n=1 Tax=Clohesyomyces aquaticus TaxID=1231657 RepID=A0A1Y1ZE86_9PLEO|nr:hypothetical protein BCR34DRAFT_589880 [Clohesyomyces aquaticus]